jgi:XTP/dITP diphosphohydrolase
MELLVATRNPGKITELRELLADLPFQLRGLDEFPQIADVEETGTTFAENAFLKAKTYAKKTGLYALADDSGLEVEALGGAPGVFSARYAGENATDAEKINKLLNELKETDNKERVARFVCVMALAGKTGEIIHFEEGFCAGRIAASPYGTNGFGYDPVFIPEDFQQTFGELPENIKQKISHRARAVEKIIRFLGDFTAP